MLEPIKLIIVGIVGLMIFMKYLSSMLNGVYESNSNQWDKLSDKEKQWYIDNYGNGKSENIDNIISDYINNY